MVWITFSGTCKCEIVEGVPKVSPKGLLPPVHILWTPLPLEYGPHLVICFQGIDKDTDGCHSMILGYTRLWGPSSLHTQSLSLLLSLSHSQEYTCHVISCPKEGPTWQGTEGASGQQSGRNWGPQPNRHRNCLPSAITQVCLETDPSEMTPGLMQPQPRLWCYLGRSWTREDPARLPISPDPRKLWNHIGWWIRHYVLGWQVIQQ